MQAGEQNAPPSSEDLRLGADVYSSDGRHIGSLARLIVDATTYAAHAIVVAETRRFSGHSLAGAAMMEADIAIPLGSVADASRERITLAITSAEARRAEPYLGYRFGPVERRDADRAFFAELSETGIPPHLVETARKRLDELEIRRGENVMLGRTGRRLGTVREVVMDEGELVGVVVHPEHVFAEDVLLQVRFLGRSDDMALFAHLSDEDLAHLTPFHPHG
jgi:sporulation protein YlmC with PRC-barrel domain